MSDWTFGIITNGSGYLNTVIQSILNQNISQDSEIIIVGNTTHYNHNQIREIPFDESLKENWITRKKNIIAEESKNDNIVILHDYIVFSHLWKDSFTDFEWDVCMTKVYNQNGERFRDWVTWDPIMFLEYDDYRFINKMYISGAYFCVKKQFLLDNPLNETLSWGESEDVEWSLRVRNKWNYKCNPQTAVKMLKYKHNAVKNFINKTDDIEKHSDNNTITDHYVLRDN